MKKLRLDLDALQVESFDPSSDQHTLRGTVDGQQIQPVLSRRLSECDLCMETQNSCLISCGRTCLQTCNGSCLQSCNISCTCPQPSLLFTDCGCPIRTQLCDTRLCPIEDTFGACASGVQIC
jgi:hypothetical protein